MIDDFIKKHQRVPVLEYQNNVVKNPLVSVLVITYQHVDYIKSCLDGLLMQKTDFPFEILLGEDDSTDGTREICIEYAKKNPKKIRLFLHSRENNILIDGFPTWHFNSIYIRLNTKGKYIASCEGDDFWTDPLKLQKQVDFLDANKNFSACTHLSNVIFENTKSKNLSRFNKNIKKTIFTVKDLLEYTEFHGNSLLFYRDLIDLSEMQESQLFALDRDHPIMIILATKGLIKRLPEVMSIYRRNSGSFAENTDYMREFQGNIETVNALSGYLNGFKWRAFYMKGHWHRYMIDKPIESKFKKYYHFVYYFFSSFYIFPHNLKKITVSLKHLISK